ncbi:E3 ubiquitin- ligase TRIM32, partial [Clarias magur]
MMLLGSHFNSKPSLGTVCQQAYSSTEPLNSLPTWITQALCDLGQGEKELHRLTEKQTAEVDEVNKNLDSAIFAAQKEERRLLEKVEKDHREAQQRLQQLKRENAAAARVGQSLVDRQMRKMGQLKEQILMWGRCPTGANKSQLLRGVKELMQPWEISLSLKRVTFQPSPESNSIQFGEINVQEHSLTFPVGVCGPHGQKCALHTGEIKLDNRVAVSEQLSAPCNSGGEKGSSKSNSGRSRVVRKIRLSTAKDDVLSEKVKMPRPKTYKVWPHKRDTSESSQDEDSEFLSSDAHGEDLFLAIDTTSSQGELEAESPLSKQSETRRHSFSKGHQKQRVLVPVSSQEPSCPPEERRPEDYGQNHGFRREMSPPMTSFADAKSSYSCVDLSWKEHPQYGQSFGGPRRSPSPAGSTDSSYTYTIRSASSCSGSLKGENQHSISTSDLSAGGHHLRNGKEKIQRRLNQSNLSRPQGQCLKRSETLDLKDQHLKDSCESSKQVSRSWSMSDIEGRGRGTRVEHNVDRSKKRGASGLPKVVEKGRTLRAALLVKKFGKQGSGRTDFTLPSGVHATAQGQLFVVDCGNVRVQVTDLQKNIVQQVTLPAVDSTSRHCRNFFDVAANSKGLIALTCAAERALLVFNRHGRLLQTFGGSGTQQDFEAPRGVTVTRLDEFLVADIRRGTLTTLKLDPKTGTKIERTIVTGFYRPYLVAACLTTGLMAVTERGNETGRAACVRVLEPGWNTIRTLGVCSGMGPVLTSPWGICIDADGNVLVADWGKQHRVVLYPAFGVGRDIVTQGLNSPRGLALLPE